MIHLILRIFGTKVELTTWGEEGVYEVEVGKNKTLHWLVMKKTLCKVWMEWYKMQTTMENRTERDTVKSQWVTKEAKTYKTRLIAEAYNVMVHMNSRMLEFWLQLKEYITVIKWREMICVYVAGEKEQRKGREREESPYLKNCKMESNNNNKNVFLKKT